MDSCIILLVEDDPNDAFFFERALKDLGFVGKLEHLVDAPSAHAYLAGQPPYENRAEFPLPAIVVSDSSLPPRGSGIELLEWMRRQPDTAKTPFVILSGEITREVRDRANAAGVQLILRKGSSFKETAEALREVMLQLPAKFRPCFK